MIEELKVTYQIGYNLGKKHGIVRGLRMWKDTNAEMGGAIGAVIIFAGVLIALYLTSIVTGALSQATVPIPNGTVGAATTIYTGGMNSSLNTKWSQTLYGGIDPSSSSAFSMAQVLPIAIIGTSIMGIVIGAFAMR